MGLIMLGRQNYTAEPLVPEPSVFDVEMAVGKLKKDTNHQVLIKNQQTN
jgi:hypothetical protein